MSKTVFCTVLHSLLSPENVGTIVRSHVAFGGGPVVFLGREKPWQFRKKSQAFSRGLERMCELIFHEDDDQFFAWAERQRYTPIAIEIGPSSKPLPSYPFPSRPAIVVGSERQGLSSSFLHRCHDIVVIPQFGQVGCLNVGVSCAIALYELNRRREDAREIVGSAFVPA